MWHIFLRTLIPAVLVGTSAPLYAHSDFEMSGSLFPTEYGFDIETAMISDHWEGMYNVSFDAQFVLDGEPMASQADLEEIVMMSLDMNEPFARFMVSTTDDGLAGAGSWPVNFEQNTTIFDGPMSFNFEATLGTPYFGNVAFMFPTEMVPDEAELRLDYHMQVTAVPEAEIWAMLLAGIGFVGWTLRRKQSTDLPVAQAA
jgi:hypothetical protein